MRIYGLLNVVLLIAAVAVTSLVAKQQPDTEFEIPRIKALDRKAGSGQARTVDQAESASVHQPLPGPVDVLWQRSLFRPDRTEEVSLTLDDDKNGPPSKWDMELVGVGIIGDRAAAVILVEEVRTTTRGRRATRRSAASPAEKKPTRHIYRLGQSVEKTGYTVKEIEMTRVVLAKGDEERVLELESGDAGSEKRVKSAVAAADKARAAAPARKSTKTDSASTAPAPPPPPPMPTGIVPAGTGRTAAKTTSGTRTTSTQLSKEERVRRALEARRRLLEERKKKSNQ